MPHVVIQQRAMTIDVCTQKTRRGIVMNHESAHLGGPPTGASNAPNLPAAVGRAAFQAELDRLRVREKARTREGDAIAAARRRLPMVEVDANLALSGPHGPLTLPLQPARPQRHPSPRRLRGTGHHVRPLLPAGLRAAQQP